MSLKWTSTFRNRTFLITPEEIIVSTTLNLHTLPRNYSKASASISAKKFERLTVVEQVIQAFSPGHRIAACIGALTGGCIPALTFCVAHLVLPYYRGLSSTLWGMLVEITMWGMVGGGLICSAPKVYKWFSAAFGSQFEAAGAVICLEAVMTFAPVVYLSAAALAVLVFVNAIYCACRLQVRS